MCKTIALITLGLSLNAFTAVNTTYFDTLDVRAVHDMEVKNEQKGEAPSFAVPRPVSIRPEWTKTDDGFVWMHRVTAPNAVSLNFGFNQFNLPEGAELNIYSADHSQFIRAFTAKDNNLHHELWTPVIMSDDVIIEVTAPAASVDKVQLELGQIGQGFRTFSETTLKSGSCNIDVACTDSRGWEKEINTVAVIATGGSKFCTGFMVNNTKNDRTPFFMTAAHCRITDDNAATLVTYWNYQSSKCKGPRDGKLTDFQTGAVHLATSAPSDFTLVKLLSTPKAEWKVHFAGWDANPAVGTPATAIHHPNTDEKSITFENDPTVVASYGGTDSPGDGTHVRIVDWDKGTTEPGSSGSPLFNDKHRVIGQLHGGGAACGNDLSDYFGRLNISWGAGLKQHLDAANTGKTTADTL